MVDVLVSAKNMTRNEWLNFRKGGIGGSDVLYLIIQWDRKFINTERLTISFRKILKRCLILVLIQLQERTMPSRRIIELLKFHKII